MRDSTFLSYIAPSARAALDTARRASVPGCQTVRAHSKAGAVNGRSRHRCGKAQPRSWQLWQNVQLHMQACLALPIMPAAKGLASTLLLASPGSTGVDGMQAMQCKP